MRPPLRVVLLADYLICTRILVAKLPALAA